MKSNDAQAKPTTDPDRLMNEHEAAEVLCYSVRALQNWGSGGGGPKFIKVSARSVRYRRRDLLDWIEARWTCHGLMPLL